MVEQERVEQAARRHRQHQAACDQRGAALVARGLVLAMASGCLFNSFLLDHTEGLAFAWMSALLFGGLAPNRK